MLIIIMLIYNYADSIVWVVGQINATGRGDKGIE